MKNAVIYARYSSEKQTEQSIEGQVRVCAEFAARNNYNVIHIYTDRAKSGTNDNRDDFQQMLKDSDKGMFLYVLVYKLDRFARNRYDSAINKRKLKNNGVKVLSAMENITDTPEGIILESVLEGYAEFFSADLKQKVTRGMRESALKCQATGGNIAFGYTIVNKKFELHPTESLIVKQIFEKYDGGMTMQQILKDINATLIKTTSRKVLTKSSISRILCNEKYIGTYRYADIVIEDGVPHIIDKELFRRVQRKMQENKKSPARGKAKEEYLLSGKMFCGKCNNAMIGDSAIGSKGVEYKYYTCSNRKNKSKSCDKQSVNKNDIELYVVSQTVEYVLQDSVIDEIAIKTSNLHQELIKDDSILNSLVKELNESQKSLNNIVSAIEKGIFNDTMQEKILNLENEIKELKLNINNEKLYMSNFLKPEQVKSFLNSFKDGDASDKEYQKKVIDTFIHKIILYDDEIKIIYNNSPNSINESRLTSENSDNAQLVLPPRIELEFIP